MPLKRVLEPEVMDTPQEAADYDAMDHGEVNRLFVDDLREFCRFGQPGMRRLKVLDVGTGTAQIPIELCRRSDPPHVTGIDLSAEMLKLGRKNVTDAGLQDHISLAHVDAKSLPYETASFDAVISNSIVHHLPEPTGVIVEMSRVLRPGGVLFVRDLLRPPDDATLEQLVETYAVGANEHQRQLFRQSLHAALMVEEVGNLLLSLQLPARWVTQTSDRHWTIAGQC